MTGQGTGTREDVKTIPKQRTKRPRRFKVLLFNDDYTTMEFVIDVLCSVFRRTPAEATSLMLKVHREGRAVAGVYPHDVAETKVLLTHELARSAGYPLRAGLEEE